MVNWEAAMGNEQNRESLDVVLQRCAWIAQILLVLAGIAGYFLTVRPIYQKQLLDEQIAERTVALRTATTELDRLMSESAHLREDNDRLSKSSEEVYKRLRANLTSAIYSAGTSCGIVPDSSQVEPRQVDECVQKYIRDNVIINLREADKVRLTQLVEKYRPELIRAVKAAATGFASKARQLTQAVAKGKAEIASAEKEAIADIRQHRQGKSSLPPIESVHDISPLQDEYERRALVKYLFKYYEVSVKMQPNNTELIFHDSEFGSARADAIHGVMKKIAQDFTR